LTISGLLELQAAKAPNADALLPAASIRSGNESMGPKRLNVLFSLNDEDDGNLEHLRQSLPDLPW
jgi:hypothetical protein